MKTRSERVGVMGPHCRFGIVAGRRIDVSSFWSGSRTVEEHRFRNDEPASGVYGGVSTHSFYRDPALFGKKGDGSLAARFQISEFGGFPPRRPRRMRRLVR